MTHYPAAAKFTSQYILPVGFITFLTFLCIIESRSSYHTLIYLLISLPALIVSIIRPKLIFSSLKSTVFKITITLCFFAILSTLWNNSEVADSRSIRYIINIILFSLAVTYIHLYQQTTIERTLLLAATIWAGFGLIELYNVYYQQGLPISSRIVGSGSLSNTLLTSHVYGAFATFIASHYLASTKYHRYQAFYLVIFLSLILFIIQTHSRTPLLAMVAVFGCLLFKHRNKKVIYVTSLLLASFSIYTLFNYDLLIQRGFSYRPEIWLTALNDIQNKPFFGHGIGSKMSLFIPSLNKAFSDSHNIHIGLTYQLGLAGLVIWLALFVYLFRLYLKNTHNVLIATGFPMFIYGITAGMTEGGSFFSRPKEVWFLIWLPIAIMVAADVYQQDKKS